MENGSKKAKLVVTLKRHAQYAENYKKFEEISKGNKERAEKENPGSTKKAEKQGAQ